MVRLSEIGGRQGQSTVILVVDRGGATGGSLFWESPQAVDCPSLFRRNAQWSAFWWCVVGAVKEPAAKTQDASTAQVPYEQQSSTRGVVGVAGYK